MYKIIRREAFSETTFLWEVSAPNVAICLSPGHFVMLRLHDGSERIPLTVADFYCERGTITMVIQALGKTTLEMRDHYKEGDGFADFVGPLGLPQHVSRAGHVVLVGGGLGVAPVYPQLRAFKEASNRVTGIIGFRNKDLVFWEDRFAKYCDNLIVCTDDGSYGRKGMVTHALTDLIESRREARRDHRPGVMMKFVCRATLPFGIPTQASLNPLMVDGTGMCGACRVTVGGKTRFACVEGPEFDGHQVDFDELITRLAYYQPEERASLDSYHRCRLDAAADQLRNP